MGADVVRREIDKCKLKRFEIAKLQAIMERAATGTLRPPDVKHLGDGLLELRFEGEKRIFRLFYSEVDDQGPVLLALKFINKKSTQGIATQPGDIDSARKRLTEWSRRKRP
ncbi:type II toxin-antitoxin system RelE/ParE family toxin [Kitasatospora sp. NPDC086791]|uniref:type II toxin-antitoxin system RelE/ParE family toxin n=1 Tax=Kitasatospora sp. NPDC086791 TaxID=3155178 RepID=UPI00341CED46